jgi:uncharacterized protein YceH (UPF0502 family)
VLGCLVEKQLTTPQQYPLTLNALVAAANQATNRDPVVTLDEDTVLAAVDELRTAHLVRVVLPSHGRSVKRYRQVLDEVHGLDPARYALLGALLLRGPQTVGELRARTERMVDFPSAEDVQEQLAVLADHSEDLARLTPRRPGQKEDRWCQTIADPWSSGSGSTADRDDRRGSTGEEPDVGTVLNVTERTDEDHVRVAAPGDAGRPGQDASMSHHEGLDELRTEVATLRVEVADLRRDLDALRQGLGG